MNIIIRAIGERTEKECVRLASQQGNVHVIRAYPFGESIRQTYNLALELGEKWTPVIDADVLLYDGVLKSAINELNRIPQNIFCLDGKTKDKIMIRSRRAGIHIYKTALLEKALKYIDNDHIKPESNVRNKMEKDGFITYSGGLCFGRHDYEQYYKDLWRKSVAQTQKLKKLIDKTGIVNTWNTLSIVDTDYRVILAGHRHGLTVDNITIDARIDYGAEEGLKKLKLDEKGEYEKLPI